MKLVNGIAVMLVSACSSQSGVTANGASEAPTRVSLDHSQPSDTDISAAGLEDDYGRMDQEMPSGAEDRSEASALNVSAWELSRSIKSNEYAAEKKYANRRLRITGIVKSVTKPNLVSANSNLAINLVIDNQFDAIEAQLAVGKEDSAINLTKGDPVELLCEGYTVEYGTTELHQCDVGS